MRGPCAGMVRRAYGSSISDHEIEDIYASAWMGTLRSLESRQGSMDDEEIRRYVCTAVAHQAGKEIRRRRRRPVAPLERAASLVDRAAPPHERADQLEQSQITRDLLSSLPRRRRAVLLLRYGWGLEPAQVCELIEGLSPRAYRKEITRGVDELTAKIRTLESGGWCADREPVLKAFAAGLADAEQTRQAQHHLAHCRPCTEFVGKLSGHLHDLGSAVVVPGLLDLADDGRIAVPDRLADLAERARDSAAGLFSKGGASVGDGLASLPAAAPRGVGAAGAGLVAKIVGLGAAGKAVLACAAGGAVATVCVVAGVGPLDLRQAPRPERPAPQREQAQRPPRVEGILPSQVGAIETEPAPSAPGPAPPPPEDDPEPPAPAPPPPVAQEPTVPGPVQQFDVAPPPSSTGGGSSGGGGSRGEVAAQEFGP
jgi:RNA polymerase sigma factor (sigma-70 family)